MNKKDNIEKYSDKALDFHTGGKPGKIEIISSKDLASKRFSFSIFSGSSSSLFRNFKK